jgi:hypothetical protein
MFKVSFEWNLTTGKITGDLYYLGEDDKFIFSRGISGPFAIPIEGVPVGTV